MQCNRSTLNIVFQTLIKTSTSSHSELGSKEELQVTGRTPPTSQPGNHLLHFTDSCCVQREFKSWLFQSQKISQNLCPARITAFESQLQSYFGSAKRERKRLRLNFFKKVLHSSHHVYRPVLNLIGYTSRVIVYQHCRRLDRWTDWGCESE